MKTILLTIILFLLPTTGQAEEFTQKNIDDSLRLAKSFAECSGIYKAIAEDSKPLGKDAVETIKGLSRGAYAVSGYLLNMARSFQGKPVLKLKKHDPYVKSVSETSYVHFKALLDVNDSTTANKLYLPCKLLGPSQAEFVNEIRQEMYGLK